MPNSFGAEELSPQGQATIAGNVISDNGDPKATRWNEAAYDPAFGVGVVIAGGQQDVITKNRVVDNDKVGIALAPSIGLEDTPHQPVGNRVIGNVVQRSGFVDLGVVASGADDQNCFSGNTFSTSAPSNIEQVMPCDATGTGDFTTGAVDISRVPRHDGQREGRDLQAVTAAEEAAHHAAGDHCQGTARGRAGAGRRRRPPGARGHLTHRGERQRWCTRDRRAAKQSPKLIRNTTSTARNALPRSSQCQPESASERRPSSR